MKFRCLLLFAVLSMPLGFAYADLNWDETIPTDPKIKTGQLANGLRYLIRKNALPEKSVELRLVVRAGSLNEADDQQGAAHFVEHLAFENSKNFPNKSLVSKLEEIGLKFGGEIGAFTTFDHTKFQLTVPTTRSSDLSLALTVLHDWASGVQMRESDFNSERKVIEEEARLRNNLEDRKQDAMIAAFLPDTRFAQRKVIGEPKAFAQLDLASVQRFYAQYYQAHRMALIVVGDVDEVEMEKKIAAIFSDIPSQAIAEDLPNLSQAAPAKTKLSFFVDPEQVTHTVEIETKVAESIPMLTFGQWRARKIEEIYEQLFQQRLSVSRIGYENAAGGGLGFLEHRPRVSIWIERGQDGFETALRAVVAKALQIEQYGFKASELDAKKKIDRMFYQNWFTEREKNQSADLAAQLISHFVYGDVVIDPEHRHQWAMALYDTISLKEVNDFARTHSVLGKGKRILYSAPKQSELPTEAELLGMIAGAEKQTVPDYKVIAPLPSIIKTPLAKSGRIISEKWNPQWGTTEMVLSNGIKLSVKNTDFMNDEIVLLHERLGGESLFSDHDYLAARYSDTLIRAMGFDNLSPRAAGDFLAQKHLSFEMAINPNTERIRGVSDQADLETLFQLLYQRVSRPSHIPVLFDAQLKYELDNLQRAYENPIYVLQDQLLLEMYGRETRLNMLPKLSSFDAFSAESILPMFRFRNQNFNGSHFVLVGNIDLKQLRPLAEKYLAILPSQSKPTNLIARPLLPKSGAQHKTIYFGEEEKAVVRILYHGTRNLSSKEELNFAFLRDLLDLRMTERLRQQKPLIYTQGVQISMNRFAEKLYQLDFYLPCAPKNVKEVSDVVREEVGKLRRGEIKEADLEKVKANWLVAMKTHRRENQFWAEQILEERLYGREAMALEDAERTVKNVNGFAIRETASLLLNDKRVFEMDMLPDSMRPASERKLSYVQPYYGAQLLKKIKDEMREADRSVGQKIRFGRENMIKADVRQESSKIDALYYRLQATQVSQCLLPVKEFYAQSLNALLRGISDVSLPEDALKKEVKLELDQVRQYSHFEVLADGFVTNAEPIIRKCRARSDP